MCIRDSDYIGPCKALAGGTHTYHDFLTGQPVSHENDATVVVSGDACSTVCRFSQRERQFFAITRRSHEDLSDVNGTGR